MQTEIPAEVKESLLSFLRDNREYAHPGEEIAIDMLFSSISCNSNRTILDVGCGLGGTADYIYKSSYGNVIGIDISAGVIKSAKATYPHLDFYHCDVMRVNEILKKRKFDLICMINSFFYFSDQETALKNLKKRAHSNTKLLLFEYSNISTNTDIQPKLYGDKGEMIFNPVIPSEISSLLLKSGWSMDEFHDISKEYLLWYQDLVNKIEDNKNEIISLFSLDALKWAKNIYNGILKSLKRKEIGGCILTASVTSV